MSDKELLTFDRTQSVLLAPQTSERVFQASGSLLGHKDVSVPGSGGNGEGEPGADLLPPGVKPHEP